MFPQLSNHQIEISIYEDRGSSGSSSGSSSVSGSTARWLPSSLPQTAPPGGELRRGTPCCSSLPNAQSRHAASTLATQALWRRLLDVLTHARSCSELHFLFFLFFFLLSLRRPTHVYTWLQWFQSKCEMWLYDAADCTTVGVGQTVSGAPWSSSL